MTSVRTSHSKATELGRLLLVLVLLGVSTTSGYASPTVPSSETVIGWKTDKGGEWGLFQADGILISTPPVWFTQPYISFGTKTYPLPMRGKGLHVPTVRLLFGAFLLAAVCLPLFVKSARSSSKSQDPQKFDL